VVKSTVLFNLVLILNFMCHCDSFMCVLSTVYKPYIWQCSLRLLVFLLCIPRFMHILLDRKELNVADITVCLRYS